MTFETDNFYTFSHFLNETKSQAFLLTGLWTFAGAAGGAMRRVVVFVGKPLAYSLLDHFGMLIKECCGQL